MRVSWGKHPLVIRGALAGYEFPLAEEHLKEMASEPKWSSRIILEQGEYEPWAVHYGPFEGSDYDALPETGWTLLVSDTDRCNRQVASLMDSFRFVPNWRLDDVQVSLAAPGGSAGPHVDNYDVFLIQGAGHRRWQIESKRAHSERALRTDTDLAILAEFEPDEEWDLGPGDLLYLPPRFPHWGIALDTCMTYSIGFRAPGEKELAYLCLEELTQQVSAETSYEDKRTKPTLDPGLIDTEVLSWVRTTMESLLFASPERLERLFCSHVTTPKRLYFPEQVKQPLTREELIRLLKSGASFERSAAAHLAYARLDQGTVLFALGHEYEMAPHLTGFAQLLTGTAPLDIVALKPYFEEPEATTILSSLVTSGALYVPSTTD